VDDQGNGRERFKYERQSHTHQTRFGGFFVAMTPRGLRNNNPGNIRVGAPWQGLTGEDNAGFCTFDTPEHGIRALAKVLLSYQGTHKLLTLRAMVTRWAPPNENDTEAYIESVCQSCCASPDNPYTLTPSRMLPLVKAIIRHENGQMPYPPDVVQNGVDAAYL
jgi:hypothetical protein